MGFEIVWIATLPSSQDDPREWGVMIWKQSRRARPHSAWGKFRHGTRCWRFVVVVVSCVFFIFAEVPRINKVWSYDLRRRFLPETLTAKWLAVGVACLLFWLRSSKLAVCGREIVPPENTFSNPWICRECWRGLVAACQLVAAQNRGGPSSAISAPNRRDRRNFLIYFFVNESSPCYFLLRHLLFFYGEGIFKKRKCYYSGNAHLLSLKVFPIRFRPWYF